MPIEEEEAEEAVDGEEEESDDVEDAGARLLAAASHVTLTMNLPPLAILQCPPVFDNFWQPLQEFCWKSSLRCCASASRPVAG